MAKDRFKDWVVLGSVDMDVLVEQHCISVADYERNLKSLKSKGKEAEKLPQYVKYYVLNNYMYITSVILLPCINQFKYVTK